MSKFLLCDWEINSRDDSDFMCVYYDDVANKLACHMYGTTRCAAPTNYTMRNGISSIEIDGEPLIAPTLEAIEGARKLLEDFIANRITITDKRSMEEPDVNDLTKGMMVRLKVTHRNQVKEKEPCRKCGGSGKWTNPNNTSDKRNCFTCKGEGQFTTRTRVKGENGKCKWDVIPEGTVGSVVDWGSFGRFFSNGYNKPDRYNTTVQVRTADGKVFKAPLEKLRCARECMTEKEVRAEANKLSYNYHFGSIGRFTWYSSNLVQDVLDAHKVA